MHIDYTDEQKALRSKLRAYFEELIPPERRGELVGMEGGAQIKALIQKMGRDGWLGVGWPKEYGGRGLGAVEQSIWFDEVRRAQAPMPFVTLNTVGPALMAEGTPEQKRRFLPAILAGEVQFAIGYSEPEAGTDLAALKTTALRDGDHYVLRGQKTWASRGAFADWLFGLFRTDPASERHRGLSFLLVPLDAPGVTVRPIAQLDGETGFAEVFFDDARVPAANLLGAEGEGWKVAMATAGFERGLMLRSPARFQDTAKRLVSLYRENEADADPLLREAVVRCWVEAEAYTLETYRTVSRLLGGGKIGAEASLNKIFWSELDLRMHETALRILGARAELLPEAPAARGVGDWLDGYLFSLSGPIYAGTNEIQRNVIAERILGLPKGA